MKATLCRTPLAMSLVLVLALASAATLLAATAGIMVYVDGRAVPAKAVVIEGRTYLPVRAVGEALGCTVEWDSATKSVHIARAGQAVTYSAATQSAPAHAPEPHTYSATTRDVGTAAVSDTVHVTRTGSKYHRAGCRYLAKSDIPMTRTEAQAKGLTPCKVCKP